MAAFGQHMKAESHEPNVLASRMRNVLKFWRTGVEYKYGSTTNHFTFASLNDQSCVLVECQPKAAWEFGEGRKHPAHAASLSKMNASIISLRNPIPGPDSIVSRLGFVR